MNNLAEPTQKPPGRIRRAAAATGRFIGGTLKGGYHAVKGTEPLPSQPAGTPQPGDAAQAGVAMGGAPDQDGAAGPQHPPHHTSEFGGPQTQVDPSASGQQQEDGAVHVALTGRHPSGEGDADTAVNNFRDHLKEDLMQDGWLRSLATSPQVFYAIEHYEDPGETLALEKRGLTVKLSAAHPADYDFREEELDLLLRVLVGDAHRIDAIGSKPFIEYMIRYAMDVSSLELTTLLRGLGKNRLIDGRGVIRDKILCRGDALAEELIQAVNDSKGESAAQEFRSKLYATRTGAVRELVEHYTKGDENQDIASVFGAIVEALRKEDIVTPGQAKAQLLDVVEGHLGPEERAKFDTRLRLAEQSREIEATIDSLKVQHDHPEVVAHLEQLLTEYQQQSEAVTALREALNDLEQTCGAAGRQELQTKLKEAYGLAASSDDPSFLVALIKAIKRKPPKFNDIVQDSLVRLSNPLLDELNKILTDPTKQVDLAILKARLKINLSQLYDAPDEDIDRGILTKEQREKPKPPGTLLGRTVKGAKQKLGLTATEGLVVFGKWIGRSAVRVWKGFWARTWMNIPVPNIRKGPAVLTAIALASLPFTYGSATRFFGNMGSPEESRGTVSVRLLDEMTVQYGVEDKDNIAYVRGNGAFKKWVKGLKRKRLGIVKGRMDKLVGTLREWKDVPRDSAFYSTPVGGLPGVEGEVAFTTWARRNGYVVVLPPEIVHRPKPAPAPDAGVTKPDAGVPKTDVKPEKRTKPVEPATKRRRTPRRTTPRKSTMR